MNLELRLTTIFGLFHQLESMSGRLDKEDLVNEYYNKDIQLKEDIMYCFEVLAGRHKVGYSLYQLYKDEEGLVDPYYEQEISLRDYCKGLHTNDYTEANIAFIMTKYALRLWFLIPLFNREWKLGIGPSQLSKDDTSPMLAKKYEHGKTYGESIFFITEKLDGNRCVAYYDTDTAGWILQSRSGKRHKASFDMGNLSREYIYDGEIMSLQQLVEPSQENFNSLSGSLNSKYGDKSSLVYVIFDIITDDIYQNRRAILDSQQDNLGKNVRILPVLTSCDANNLAIEILTWLEIIVSKGGEGIMINLGHRNYEHKRTDALLKVKNTYTMDMKVIGLEEGTGKNLGLVGSLHCRVLSDDGKIYECKVGSGLSDNQRKDWACNPSKIMYKIVEVAYFSISQNSNIRGSDYYSLRFPRLKRIRNDKLTTSVD